MHLLLLVNVKRINSGQKNTDKKKGLQEMMNYNSEDWGVNQTSAKCLQLNFLFRFMSMSFQLFRTFKQDVIVTRQNIKQDNKREYEEIEEHEENY